MGSLLPAVTGSELGSYRPGAGPSEHRDPESFGEASRSFLEVGDRQEDRGTKPRTAATLGPSTDSTLNTNL